jgi:hypothetical protein
MKGYCKLTFKACVADSFICDHYIESLDKKNCHCPKWFAGEDVTVVNKKAVLQFFYDRVKFMMVNDERTEQYLSYFAKVIEQTPDSEVIV